MTHIPDVRSAMDRTRDQRLFHVSVAEAPSVAMLGVDGLIVTGAGATTTANAIRHVRPGMLVLVETADASRGFATADRPFLLADEDGLYADQPTSLAAYVAARLSLGDEYVLTPTGYLQNFDADALMSVVNELNTLGSDRVIGVIPADSGWLKPNRVHQLIGILQRCDYPLMLELGHTKNPLETAAKANGLITVLEALPTIGVGRADHLAGFEVAARSSGPVSTGLIPSRRRVTPPSERGQSYFARERRPQPWYPKIHRFVAMPTMETWHDQVPADDCTCAQCAPGRKPTDFGSTPDEHLAAAVHAAANLADLYRTISGPPNRRLRALTKIYAQATKGCADLSTLLKQTITVPKEQSTLAGAATTARRALVRTSFQQRTIRPPRIVAPQTSPPR